MDLIVDRSPDLTPVTRAASSRIPCAPLSSPPAAQQSASRRPRTLTALVLVVAALLAALAAAPAANAALKARGSIKQAYVIGAKKGQKLQLTRHGRVIASGAADALGSRIFRELRPGRGYAVRTRKGARPKPTRSFKVLRPGANPRRAFYKRKKLKQGLNYVRMRDGVEIAMTVRLPPGKTLADGPFPTFVEYSGYQTAAPHDLLQSVIDSLSGGGGPSDPLAPATSTAVGSLIGPLIGFAVVSVQMRGSGCSGGAFDLFDYPTTFDGYDAVETVGAQSWVKGGKVGMGGISFSGITQLFTAGTRPPHLAAVTPMSVTDDIYQGTGYPGGIFNSGFAQSWIQERMDDAKPAPAGGQPWAKELVKAGDKHCIANQRLRLQTQDALQLQKDNPYRTPSLFAHRAPGAWLKRANVPIFLVGQFQDEQTSGHFAEALKYLNGKRDVYISVQNGVHADSLGPSTITRWAEFLNLYVADEIPNLPSTVTSLSGALYTYLADAAADPVLQSRYVNYPSVAAAKADFKKDPHVRILMDNGGGPKGPGSIGAPWELNYSAWPPREAKAARYYLGAGGALGAKPAKAGSASYVGRSECAPAPDAPGQRRRGRLEGAAALPVGSGGRGQGPRLRDRRAGQGHGDRRHVEPRRLPQVFGQGHRPPGDAHRGPARRQRDLRPERLAARLPPEAERAPVHRARSRTHAPGARRGAAAQGQVLARARAVLPGGPRLPGRLAHPGHDHGHRRGSPALGLLHRGQGEHEEHDQPRRIARLEPGAAGGLRRHREGHSASGRHRASRRAQPHVRRRVQRRLTLLAAAQAPMSSVRSSWLSSGMRAS